jgi:two-component system, HptB-dependent secretion and biofilm response regulator
MLEVENAQIWYEELWQNLTKNERLQSKASLAFTEMLLNAHEHGNLGIDSTTKHQLISSGDYWDFLEQQEVSIGLFKKIIITLHKIYNDANEAYIITNIKDEGKGFDTQILSKIFKVHKQFNGKGVYLSRKSSYGIYYNTMGNDVTFIHKLQSDS